LLWKNLRLRENACSGAPITEQKLFRGVLIKKTKLMNALYLIIALFALGALVGMYLLALVIQGKKTPKAVAFIHGVFVVAALSLLIYYAFGHGPGLTETIVLFVVAALGGITMIIRDLNGKSLPRWLAIGHGLIAVTGFIFLLVYAFR
jgi:hypothetical protein